MFIEGEVELATNTINNKFDTRVIDVEIKSIQVKGDRLELAAPIKLIGELKVDKLRVNLLTQTASLEIGVDEAGRGPLLGSVNVAAAILPSAWSGLIEEQPLRETPLALLTDSKKLSEKKRDLLYPLVQQYAIGYIIADVPAAVIDQLNILQATMLGMRLCTEVLLKAIAESLIKTPETISAKSLKIDVLFDGNRCPDLDYFALTKLGIQQANIDCQAWVKGDARHTSIAAASILAKVSRDITMYQLAIEHPNYGIAKHKGYPTREHIEAIDAYGVLPEHRCSFGPVKRELEKQHQHNLKRQL